MKPTLATKTILVVDDDNTMRWILVSVLKRKGYVIVEAHGAHHALELLQTESVDLIISDIQMPGGDGFELIRTLRSSSVHPPLIFMSGGVELNEFDLKDLGASHFLTKPVATHDLLRAIQVVLDKAA